MADSDTNSAQRILLIRLSALGDVLHALPALAAIRRAMPGSFIGWLVEDRAESMLAGHPMLDTLHVVPRRAWKQDPFGTLTGPMRDLVGELREQHYDTAIDFQGLTKSAFWTKLCGAPERIGFSGEEAREVSRFFYNRPVFPRADQVHVIERNLSLLRPLGIEDPPVEFNVHLDDELQAFGRATWQDLGDRFPRIVMNPGAGWPTKQWPAASYGRLAAELIREVGARVALAWGPGEEVLVQTALEATGAHGTSIGKHGATTIGDEPGLYPLPRTSFMQLGGVIKHSHLFVGGDTGPTHLAAALNIPTLGLYGASDAKRNGPWGTRCRSIQLSSPSCIPCWKTKCEWDEPLACLTHIHVGQARELCLELLAQS